MSESSMEAEARNAEFTYRPSDSEALSTAVVTAVREASDGDPFEDSTSLSEAEVRPLYEVIDPDALDSLFRPTPRTDRAEGQVTFRYAGYEVTVSSSEEVSVRPAGASE